MLSMPAYNVCKKGALDNSPAIAAILYGLSIDNVGPFTFKDVLKALALYGVSYRWIFIVSAKLQKISEINDVLALILCYTYNKLKLLQQ